MRRRSRGATLAPSGGPAGSRPAGPKHSARPPTLVPLEDWQTDNSNTTKYQITVQDSYSRSRSAASIITSIKCQKLLKMFNKDSITVRNHKEKQQILTFKKLEPTNVWYLSDNLCFCSLDGNTCVLPVQLDVHGLLGEAAQLVLLLPETTTQSCFPWDTQRRFILIHAWHFLIYWLFSQSTGGDVNLPSLSSSSAWPTPCSMRLWQSSSGLTLSASMVSTSASREVSRSVSNRLAAACSSAKCRRRASRAWPELPRTWRAQNEGKKVKLLDRLTLVHVQHLPN